MIERSARMLDRIHRNRLFEFAIVAVIIISSLLIGVKTYDIKPQYLYALNIADLGITIFFLVELLIRFFTTKDKKRFFNNMWNVFDALIVTVSLLPIDQAEYALLARLIRIFRVLRLVSAIPELRQLVNALMKALPSMGYVALLMFILFYIYAAIGSFIFEAINPVLWGDIAISMLTLFRVVTFEDWTDVMYEVMEVHPYAWMYFLSFIFLNAFVFLNMMIGIVIEKMQEERDGKQILEKNRVLIERHENTEERLKRIEVKIDGIATSL